jgi:transposase
MPDIMKKAAPEGHNGSRINHAVLSGIGAHPVGMAHNPKGGAAMYVGVDYHKRYSVTTQMDENGKVLGRARLSNDPDTLRDYVESLPAGSKIAFEATGNWYYFYELLEDGDLEVNLAHPLQTKAIAWSRIKTDKIDSRILAHLLRSKLLPTAYIPPREIRDLREILRYRCSLVHLRTQIKNKVHAILSKNGIEIDVTDIFGKKGMRRLKSLSLRLCYDLALNGYIRLVETLSGLISEVTLQIQETAEDDPRAMLLITIPGISYYSALLILSEIGEVERFPNARKLCSYAGLVPSVHSSGGRTYHGSITKQGSKWLRWILVELSPHFVKGSERLGKMYLRVSKKHGGKKARVAVAREMLKIIYYMLRDNRAFYKDYSGRLGGVMAYR